MNVKVSVPVKGKLAGTKLCESVSNYIVVACYLDFTAPLAIR